MPNNAAIRISLISIFLIKIPIAVLTTKDKSGMTFTLQVVFVIYTLVGQLFAVVIGKHLKVRFSDNANEILNRLSDIHGVETTDNVASNSKSTDQQVQSILQLFNVKINVLLLLTVVVGAALVFYLQSSDLYPLTLILPLLFIIVIGLVLLLTSSILLQSSWKCLSLSILFAVIIL